MSGWLWNRTPAPSAEEKAAAQAAKNAQTMQRLQDQYDDKMLMSTNYGENVRRLDGEAKKFGPGTPQRVQLETQKRAAFSAMQQTKKDANLLWSQLEGLRRVTSNVQSMGTNLDLHERYKESNAVSKDIAGKVDVDAVTDTMDEAYELDGSHMEVSEALAGRGLGGVVDADEQDAEMAEFLGGHTEETIVVMAGTAAARQDDAEARWNEVQDNTRLSAYEEEVMRKLAVLEAKKQPAAVASSRGK